jgi:four helix bundle protein
MERIVSHKQLRVYQNGLALADSVFALSKGFPDEERFGLTSQINRASSSVCACIAEAWRKRRYPAAFVSTLSDVEAEAAETQVWLEIGVRRGYLTTSQIEALDQGYDYLLAQIVKMAENPEQWLLPYRTK